VERLVRERTALHDAVSEVDVREPAVARVLQVRHHVPRAERHARVVRIREEVDRARGPGHLPDADTDELGAVPERDLAGARMRERERHRVAWPRLAIGRPAARLLPLRVPAGVEVEPWLVDVRYADHTPQPARLAERASLRLIRREAIQGDADRHALT